MTDYGKWNYNRAKPVDRPAEIRLRPESDETEVEFKTKKAVKLLQTNSELLIAVKMRGKERARPDEARAMLQSVLSRLVPAYAQIVSEPDLHGSQIVCTVAPLVGSDEDGSDNAG